MRLLTLALPFVSAGCQPAPPDPIRRVKLGPAPVLTSKPTPTFRWLDAVDQPYSAAFRETFSYAKSDVVVSHQTTAPVFTGAIEARGLKPNFAYQLKLVGMPAFLWPEKGDDASNRRIGELGRWWKPGKDGGNAYAYEQNDKSKMEGYLLFGYFVTDAEGSADVPLRTDSSFHVLWRTSQWPKGDTDSTPTRHTVVAKAGALGYDQDFAEAEFHLYAEQQYDRPPMGEALLAAGDYKCFLLLTEESFHAWEEEPGGDWAAAMAAIVEFTIQKD
ncbi:hypothetical protein HQ560_12060 [bacterium]|nr:hypothetical protein [bacterium]